MLSNQSVSVHESLAPSARGVLPASLSFLITAWKSSHVLGTVIEAVLNSFGLYQMVLFELSLTMMAYRSPFTVPTSRMPGA